MGGFVHFDKDRVQGLPDNQLWVFVMSFIMFALLLMFALFISFQI